MPELPLFVLAVAVVAIVGLALGMLVAPRVGRLAADEEPVGESSDEPAPEGAADGGTGGRDDREGDR
jgi:hypothetical protein